MALEKSFPERHHAALVLAKVFFHMEKWNESIRMALLAGPLFDIQDQAVFTRTILNKAIDKYVMDKSHNACHPDSARPIDEALEQVVELMIKSCLDAGDYKQVIGIALDSCRLDVLKAVLSTAVPVMDHLRYAQRLIISHSRSLDFQQKVLELLVGLAEAQPEPDFVFICDCLVTTHDVPQCSSVLAQLLQAAASSPQKALLALQIAFNLYEVGPEFAQKVAVQLAQGTGGGEVVGILSGRVPSALAVKFLSHANSADMLVLEKTRETLNLNSSQHHSAIYYSNGLMHSGSTNDEFLRKNMDWLSHASNWAKFSAAASLGMIHRGHIEGSRTVLAPYLPKVGSTGSPYAEGGALYALGLIHSKAEPTEVPYLRDQLAATTNEVAQHGACLGLGAAALATGDEAVLDDLRGILYGDNAVSGEAASLAIGLVAAGSMDLALIDELLQYARETQHEKIIRGIAVAIALISYGARDKANGLIETMLNDKDVVIRFGAVWTVAMAYAGTSGNYAISRLLHAAVSESDDDVRRAAVTSLGFVLFKNAQELPQLLELLSASYNPHVRYGSALALGIAFCGTGDKAAIDLIKPMCKDLTDFVRQGAYIALAMILMEVSEAQCDQVAPTRKLLESVAGNKYDDAIARFGAILSQGIIDAGGRNAVLALASPSSGHSSLFGIVGTMVFCQFWYWYPCIGFLSLALEPTGMIGVDGTLQAPKFQFTSAAPPKLFAYPEATKTAQAVQPKKLTTAVLSTTAKAAARAKKSGKPTDMDVDISPSPSVEVISGPVSPMVEETPKPEEPEAAFALQDNLSRITPLQRQHVLLGADSRFVPISGTRWATNVITVLQDTKPGEPVEYMATEATVEEQPDAAKAMDVDVDVKPPEPFEEPEL